MTVTVRCFYKEGSKIVVVDVDVGTDGILDMGAHNDDVFNTESLLPQQMRIDGTPE